MPPRIKILGICGSPISGGNTEKILEHALSSAEKLQNVETDIFLTAKKTFSPCTHCNWCMFKGEHGKYCAVQDDLQPLFPKVLEADGIIFASPVYISRMSGYMAALMDRLRAFMFGKHRGSIKNKACGTISVAWYRHGGIETCGLSIFMSAYCLEMLPVSVHHSGAFYGAGAVSSIHGDGTFDPSDKIQVLKDEWGMRGAHDIAIRVVELARIIKAGMLSLTQEGTDSHILSISPLAREVWSSKGLALAKPGPEEVDYEAEAALKVKDAKDTGYKRPETKKPN
jgi:multimeric flavodoxin WrbA